MRLIRLLPCIAALCAVPLAAFAQDAPPAVPAFARDAVGIVTLKCATPGAVIRYSIDGSDIGPAQDTARSA